MIEHTTARDFEARDKLTDLMEHSPLSSAGMTFNPFLYVRSSLLAKALVMDDLYRRIVNIPGALIEFGCWNGQNLVLLENLRAIHEPFNKTRKIIGFDSFNGYDDGTYKASMDPDTLQTLLGVHEECTAFGHLRDNHTIVAGDVRETAAKFFGDWEAPIALELFDMGPYEPTIAALRAIEAHLVPGSVIMFDEIAESGEWRAFNQVFPRAEYRIEKCRIYPSKTIVTLK